MARRVSRSRFVRLAPKTKLWLGADLAVSTLPTNTHTMFATLDAASLALRTFTILRTRQSLLFRSDQTAADESPTGAYGVIVVKETASAIGATAVPGPIAEINSDFFIYQGMTSVFTFETAAGFESASGTRYEIDSKAMRKVLIDEDVTFNFEMRNVGGALLNMEGRMLIQLH